MKISKKYGKGLVLAIGFGALQSSVQEEEPVKVEEQEPQKNRIFRSHVIK